MRINGNRIMTSYGHTQDSPALANRAIEVYLTKTKVKSYLFNSSCKGWHKKANVIAVLETKPDDTRDIQKIMCEHFNTFRTEYGVMG